MRYSRWPTRRLSLPVLAAALFVGFMATNAAAQEPEPVLLLFSNERQASHPSGIAIEQFKIWLEEAIPGSEVRIFHGASLYPDEPAAVEGLRTGELSMHWGQVGSAVRYEPMVGVLMPTAVLTTWGGYESIHTTAAFEAVRQHMAERHGVHWFTSPEVGVPMLSGYVAYATKARAVVPGDYSRMQIRAFSTAVVPEIEALGGSPVVMALGEVPSALQSGVIDGLRTTVDAWVPLRELAPYVTLYARGVTSPADYYWVGASKRWWDTRLNEPTRAIIEALAGDMIALNNAITFCTDIRQRERYGTQNPTLPGVYVPTPDELAQVIEAARVKMGDDPFDRLPPDLRELAMELAEDAVRLSAANPAGSSRVEQVNCQDHQHLLPN